MFRKGHELYVCTCQNLLSSTDWFSLFIQEESLSMHAQWILSHLRILRCGIHPLCQSQRLQGLSLIDLIKLELKMTERFYKNKHCNWKAIQTLQGLATLVFVPRYLLQTRNSRRATANCLEMEFASWSYTPVTLFLRDVSYDYPVMV